MTKGQIFTTDFVVSFVIFLAVMGIGFTALNEATQEQLRFSRYNMMQRQAQQVAGLLVRTPGYPADWNAGTVEVVGFADSDHIVQETKLERFENIGSYDARRRALDIHPWDFRLQVSSETALNQTGGQVGEQPVAYIVEEGADTTEYKILHVLNGSGITWDLYWPSQKNKDALASMDARNVYNYTDAGPAMFDDMLTNASERGYNTIISESTALDTGDLKNESILESFVRDGGTFLHTEKEPSLIKPLFNLSETGIGSNNNGTVVTVQPLLNDSYQVGDYIRLQDVQMAFKGADVRFVNNDTLTPEKGCLICGWNIGEGTLYYAADTFAENDPNTTTTFVDASEAFSPSTAVFDYGKPAPSNTSFLVVEKRSILLNVSESGEEAVERVERGTTITPEADAGLVGRDDGAILYVNSSDGKVYAGETNSNKEYSIPNVRAFAPAQANLDDDAAVELPVVNSSSGDIWIDDGAESQVLFDASTSTERADDIGTAMAVGAWKNDEMAVLFTDQAHTDIVRAYANGSSTVIASPTNGVKGVSGVADVDSDGSDELVFADGSQVIRLLEQNGSTRTLKDGLQVGSNNGVALGPPGMFAGRVQVPFVDGSGNLKLVDAEGNVTTLVSGGIAKQPVATVDSDNDGRLELAAIDKSTSPNRVIIVDNIGSSPTQTVAKTAKDTTICHACSVDLLRGQLKLILWN